MAQSIAKFMQELADAFFQGDHEWLTGIYAYPLAVFLNGDIMIEETPQDALNNLFLRRASAIAAGTVRITAKVLDSGDPSQGRFPVRVDWHFIGKGGKLIAINELRYFCHLAESGEPRVEIVEFISRGIASIESPDKDPSSIH